MSGQSSTRRKNLGFKPPGVDPAHDTVYAVLEALPRGAASDFVVMAVSEYLANHAGETIEGKARKKFIILGGDAPTPSAPPAKKQQVPKTTEPHEDSTDIDKTPETEDNLAPADEQTPHDAPPLMTTLPLTHHEDSHYDATDNESADARPAAARTGLSSETLKKLVFGFPSTSDE